MFMTAIFGEFGYQPTSHLLPLSEESLLLPLDSLETLTICEDVSCCCKSDFCCYHHNCSIPHSDYVDPKLLNPRIAHAWQTGALSAPFTTPSSSPSNSPQCFKCQERFGVLFPSSRGDTYIEIKRISQYVHV